MLYDSFLLLFRINTLARIPETNNSWLYFCPKMNFFAWIIIFIQGSACVSNRFSFGKPLLNVPTTRHPVDLLTGNNGVRTTSLRQCQALCDLLDENLCMVYSWNYPSKKCHMFSSMPSLARISSNSRVARSVNQDDDRFFFAMSRKYTGGRFKTLGQFRLNLNAVIRPSIRVRHTCVSLADGSKFCGAAFVGVTHLQCQAFCKFTAGCMAAQTYATDHELNCFLYSSLTVSSHSPMCKHHSRCTFRSF